MASVVRRRGKYYVVYKYVDREGEERQRWEPFRTKKEADARRSAVEFQQQNGEAPVPSTTTVREFLKEYVEVYGKANWSLSSYSRNMQLIDHYINPILGNFQLNKLTPRLIDKYYQDLLEVRVATRDGRVQKNEYVTAQIVHQIHKLLRNALGVAVKWELITRNPAENATLPKWDKKERQIWDAETIARATELCEDPVLALSINLAFACSLRVGELCGLTWDCVVMSPTRMKEDKAYISVDKEIQRISKQAYKALGDKGIKYIFPAESDRNTSMLVLKEPKTKSSVRKIYLPRTVAVMLEEWRQQQEEYRGMLGPEYCDYNLVITYPNGRPVEPSGIRKMFEKLIKENDLPKVVFHSLRHSSVTYKLKIYNGNIKAVQGDSGHAQASMVTDTYSHILDEDRWKNAELFEKAFYEQKGEVGDGTLVTGGDEAATAGVDVAALTGVSQEDLEMLVRLLQNPEMAAMLRVLAGKLN